MITQELLAILCCPETHQALRVADPALVQQLNDKIAAGQVRNREGALVQETIESGLVRADEKFLYPIRGGIPVLLAGEAIPIDGSRG